MSQVSPAAIVAAFMSSFGPTGNDRTLCCASRRLSQSPGESLHIVLHFIPDLD